MASRITIALATVICCLPGLVLAQSGKPMTGEQLTALTKGGVTLTLGGAGLGYKGSLKLSKNGKGKGSAKTDAGATIAIEGTWVIRGDTFCRTWRGLDGGKEVCETWQVTSKNSVDVYANGKKIGANAW